MNELLKDIMAADIVDAMMKTYQHKAHIISLVSPTPDRVLFGKAVTISFMPVRKDLMDEQIHSLGPAFYKSIQNYDPKDKVLVMASNGHSDISLGGGTKLSRVRNHQLSGVLCDGRLRDFDELSSYDIAVYCKGETTRGGGNMIQPYLTDVPVTVDGVTIIPGDYIYADSTGAVVIPENDLEKILKLAHMILQKTSHAAEVMKTEDPQAIINQGSSEL